MQVIEPVTVDGIVASSTKVREFLTAGKLGGAHLLLDRNYDVDGIVVKGAGRGQTIGVPTANLDTAGVLLPKGGVYAVRAALLSEPGNPQVLKGVANLGTNPTFSDSTELSLEVHLLDFSGDLYAQKMRIEFVRRLRSEKRFTSASELVEQIHADIAKARAFLTDPGEADRK